MFLRVWPEPDLAEPGKGKDLQANAHGCRAHGRQWHVLFALEKFDRAIFIFMIVCSST